MKWTGIIVVLMGLFLCLGEGRSEAQFYLGTKGGLGISNHWSTEEKGEGYKVESGSKTGGSIGVLAGFQISRYFTVQGEILYTQKGSKQDVTIKDFPPPLGDIGAIKLIYQLDYVEVPLILKTYPLRLETIKPYTTIGPYLAFLTGDQYQFENSKLEEEVGKPFGTELEGTKDIAGIKETDYGIVFGTGVEYQLYDLRFSFDYRYTMGFVDLTLPTRPVGQWPQQIPLSSDAFPDIDLRNNCHMFILGVLY
jgi:hypothetical protein